MIFSTFLYILQSSNGHNSLNKLDRHLQMKRGTMLISILVLSPSPGLAMLIALNFIRFILIRYEKEHTQPTKVISDNQFDEYVTSENLYTSVFSETLFCCDRKETVSILIVFF